MEENKLENKLENIIRKANLPHQIDVVRGEVFPMLDFRFNDVVLALMKFVFNGKKESEVKDILFKLLYVWNMYAPLSEQPDETKKYLIDLFTPSTGEEKEMV